MADEERTVKPARAERKKPAKPDAEEPKKAEAKRAAEELAREAEADEEEEAREPQAEEPEAGKPEPPKPRAAKAKEAKKPRKAAKAEGAEEEGGEEADEEEEAEEKGAPREGKKRKAKPRPRPKLDAALTAALKLRREKNAARPNFRREEWFRYQRLGEKWRFPQGIQSKMRRHWGTHADVVSIGHRGPRAARGLHPSGFREVLIHNAQALEGLDPAREAVRIAASVGRRKREEIQNDARKMGIRVLNWRQY
jgi:large subunit ribosomal protein L32e